MNGVTIIETEAFDRMINRLEILADLVNKLTAQNIKPYLSTKEVCEMINKSENWVLLNKDKLGFHKETGALLFKRKDIDAWIDKGYVKPLGMDVRFKRPAKRKF